MRNPRTPHHFPRMKVRGARRRALAAASCPWTLWAPVKVEDATKAFAAVGVSATEAAAVLERFARVLAEATKLPERDPYLEALGREEPPTESACPVWFTWSAFGAWYMDTQCDGGELVDLDTLSRELACPMCNPATFYEQHYGGGCIVPTCARCEEMLPTGTVLQWHERGNSLSASAECEPCGKRTWTLMRDYRDALGDDIPEWEAGELTPAVVE